MIPNSGAKFNMRMRKKKHGAERLSALSTLIYRPIGIKGAFEGIFEKELPIRLEIGCGKGDFIGRMSEAESEFNYFAMEKVSDVMVVAVEKYAVARGLGSLSPHGQWMLPDGTLTPLGEAADIPLAMRGNVRFINADAAAITDIFLPGTVDTVFANFSDPWPKKGDRDKRLTSPVFLKRYLTVLRDGGSFRFKTDNIGLFEYSLETVRDSGFELVNVTKDLHSSPLNSTNIETEYERSFSAKGFLINYLEAVKK